MKLSLFWRLYIGVMGVIVAAVLISLLATQLWLVRDGHIDFLSDAKDTKSGVVHLIAGGMSSELAVEKLLSSRDFKKHISLMSDVDAQGILNQSVTEFKKNGAYVLTEVAESVTELSALFPLVTADEYLLISDDVRNDGNSDVEEEPLQAAAVAIPATLSMIACLTAALLYILCRQVEAPLRALSQNALRMSDGVDSLPADENAPHPVGTLAKSLNDMNNSIKVQLQEQQWLSNALAHEFKTPLTRMQLGLGLLDYNQTQTTLSTIAEDLNSYVDDMSNLTDQVLTYLSVGNTASSSKMATFSDVLNDRIERFSDNRIDILNSECTSAIFNELYIRLLIDNIVGNALKYAANTIIITAKQTEGEVVFKVSDDGPGIPLNQHKEVVRPFVKFVSNSDSRSTGNGLGLAIVSSVLYRMNGNIVINRSEIGGALIVISIPTERK